MRRGRRYVGRPGWPVGQLAKARFWSSLESCNQGMRQEQTARATAAPDNADLLLFVLWISCYCNPADRRTDRQPSEAQDVFDSDDKRRCKILSFVLRVRVQSQAEATTTTREAAAKQKILQPKQSSKRQGIEYKNMVSTL